MRYGIKIIFMCFLTVFSMTVSGVVPAENHVDGSKINIYENAVFSHCDELRTASENEKYRLVVYDNTAVFGLQDKKSGYIWWSSPVGEVVNKGDSQIAEEELNSSVAVRYGIPEKRSDNNFLRSGGKECDVKVSDTEGGIRVFYDFENAGFSFCADYVLDGDCLKASIKTSEISEKNPENIITEITLLENFGCADDSEEGYFIIPDGSGAVINFNNGKTWADEYRQRIYGDDSALSDEKKYSEKGHIYLPVYAVVREKNAVMAVASDGDSNAFLSAKVSGQSGNAYNTCGFTFVLRSTDVYYTSGNGGERLTVFENGGIKSGDIEVRFYPITKGNPDFTDVAECYRNYLVNECGVVPKTSGNYSPLYVEFFGGVEKKKSVMGVPVGVRQTLTDYGQAVEILSDMQKKGVGDIVVSYRNMTDNGIKNRIDTAVKPSAVLGGKSKFSGLTEFIGENNAEFYPVFDNIDFYSGNGFSRFSGAVFRVSGVLTEVRDYNLAYGIPDSMRKNRLLLSPKHFGEVFSEISENCKKSGLDGVSLGKSAETLYGDYGRNKFSRNDAQDIIAENLSAMGKNLNILADGANAYALPYVSRIVNIPLDSGGNDLFDGDIPFYQTVIHGVIPCTSTPLNTSPDIADFAMLSAVTGSGLMCDIIHENAVILNGTELDFLYYANYSAEKIADIYKIINPILQRTALSTIVGYNVENSGETISAEYSDGTVIKADFSRKTIDFDGKTISLEGEYF